MDEKQKYILVNIHGLDQWSMHHDELVGRTFVLRDGYGIQRSLSGFDFVKGWFHLENPPEETITLFPRDMNFFFVGAQFQTIEDNEKENGIMVVAQ